MKTEKRLQDRRQYKLAILQQFFHRETMRWNGDILKPAAYIIIILLGISDHSEIVSNPEKPCTGRNLFLGEVTN